MKAEHEERVQEWVAECERLKGEGVAKCCLPKKPAWPLHAHLEESVPVDDESEESNSLGEED